jgi:hypothetical protein
MPCSARDNSLNPPDFGPPPVIPGFGIPFAPLQIPFPDVKIPDGIPEDLLALLDQLKINWPGGLSLPNPDELMKTIWDGVAALLNQLAPFLSYYRFFMALLNMIICIIEVLCALMNPWATYKAIRKLYRTCLPDFLNLFPWLALIAMIIALLLLLLALLEYLLNMLEQFIKDLLANLIALGKAVQLNDVDSQLQIARKLAYILCMIEQLFAILIAFQAIMAIIQALMDMAGVGICARSSGSGCCGEEYCPDFISNSSNGVTDTAGHLMYYKTLYQNVPGFTGTLPDARTQLWQFVNNNTGATYQIKDIITPVGPDNDIFWPTPMVFDASTQLKKAPYLLEMRVYLDPATFGHADPIGGARYFRIKNIIVAKLPYLGMIDYAGGTLGPYNGTFSLTGGLVYEDDGTTPFIIGTTQASLTNFIYQAPQVTIAPFDDSINFTNIEFTWTINYEALVFYSLITMMCIPGLANDSAVLNASIDFSAVASKITLPNVAETVQCLSNALGNLRQNVSEENVAVFQAVATGCINKLQNDTKSAYSSAVIGGANDYNNSATLDPSLQFVGSPIKVTVQLKDAGGINLAAKEVGVEAAIAEKISGVVTIGNLSDFSYDGYGNFIGYINSNISGPGELLLSFNGQTFKEILHRDTITTDTAIQDRVFPYEFVGVSVIETKVRRTDADIADGEI